MCVHVCGSVFVCMCMCVCNRYSMAVSDVWHIHVPRPTRFSILCRSPFWFYFEGVQASVSTLFFVCSMHVSCVCVYYYMYVHVFLCVCMCMCVYVCVCICMCVRVCVGVCIHMSVYDMLYVCGCGLWVLI